MKKSVIGLFDFAATLTLVASLIFSIVIPSGSRVQAEILPNENIQIQNENEKTDQIRKSYAALPLNFEINQGQTNESVKFLARGSGFSLFLTGQEALIKLRK